MSNDPQSVGNKQNPQEWLDYSYETKSYTNVRQFHAGIKAQILKNDGKKKAPPKLLSYDDFQALPALTPIPDDSKLTIL